MILKRERGKYIGVLVSVVEDVGEVLKAFLARVLDIREKSLFCDNEGHVLLEGY